MSSECSVGGRQARSRAWLVCALGVLGFVLRMLLSTYGSNADMGAYWKVAGLAHQGCNVYASTTNYNYGPVWFNVLHGIYHVSGRDAAVFRQAVAGLLGVVDVGIFVVLWHRLGVSVACLFLFNPISIIITGYHSQFDNLSVLLCLLSVMITGDAVDGPLTRRSFLGLAVLGLSITTKHVFFGFPFWLAVKQQGPRRRLAALLVPTAIFLLSFAPYWSEGRAGIVENVFHYYSRHREYFVHWLVPGLVQLFVSARVFWFLSLGLFAFFFRKRSSFESVLLYTAVLVSISPSIANQYLAIVIPFTAAFMNPFLALYSAIGTVHLLVDPDALHLVALRSKLQSNPDATFETLIQMLFLGLLWSLALRTDLVSRIRRVGRDLD